MLEAEEKTASQIEIRAKTGSIVKNSHDSDLIDARNFETNAMNTIKLRRNCLNFIDSIMFASIS